MFLLQNIFLNDITQKFEKGLLMLYEMTVVNKIIITFPCLMRGKRGSSCGHMHCRITQHQTKHNHSPCWMH